MYITNQYKRKPLQSVSPLSWTAAGEQELGAHEPSVSQQCFRTAQTDVQGVTTCRP